MTRLGIHNAGAYRKLISYPKQLSWKWLESFNPYVTETSNTVTVHSGLNLNSEPQSPKELNQDANQSSEEEPLAGKDVPVHVAGRKDNDSDTDELSVEVCFSLDTSCYATVMLRELMKVES